MDRETRSTEKPACAAFRRERRMKCINTTNLNRNPGGAQPMDLQFSGPFLGVFFDRAWRRLLSSYRDCSMLGLPLTGTSHLIYIFLLLPGFNWGRLSSQVLTSGLRKELLYLRGELLLQLAVE